MCLTWSDGRKGSSKREKLVIISKPNVISEQKAVGFTELTSVLTASKSSHRKQAVSQNGLKIFVKLFRILMIQSIFFCWIKNLTPQSEQSLAVYKSSTNWCLEMGLSRNIW